MDGFLSGEVVETVRGILHDNRRREEMVQHNYELGRRYFSYERLEDELRLALARIHSSG
jgi:hypothetical protein